MISSVNINKIRSDFPILSKEINGHPLVYLDNAATTQKPRAVIEKLNEFYTEYNSNIHRAEHTLGKLATNAFESARETVRSFINAGHFEEIIFTSGATEAVNLIASSWGRSNLNEGDEIIISEMEHHSNIVPWQLICLERKAVLKSAPITNDGELNEEALYDLISENTKLISLTHISNALGSINPIKEIILKAHNAGVLVFIDGAQSIPHLKVDVQDLDCDFFAFSGHKVYGPTGIGVLFGKKDILNSIPPYQGGGDMIMSVSFEKTTFNHLPYKFEAGTQNIAGAIALGSALNYVKNIGLDAIMSYEEDILNYALNKIKNIDGIKIIGNARKRSSIISFVFDDVHPNDIGSFLDLYGVAVRTGHHCAEPIMKKFNIPSTTRASFALYNTKEEVDILVDSLNKVLQMLRN